MTTPSRVASTLLLLLSILLPAGLTAQDPALEAARRVASLRAEPAELALTVGETASFRIVAVDAEGNVVEGVTYRIFARGGVEEEDGVVSAVSGGEASVTASLVTPEDYEGQAPRIDIPVAVSWPAVTEVEITALDDERHYEGTALRYGAAALHADGSARPDPEFTWSTSDPSVATVDARGFVTTHAAGPVDIYAAFEAVRGTLRLDVPALPATSLRVTGGVDQVRQGDVVRFEVEATDASGRRIDDVAILWSVQYTPDDSIQAPGASGIVRDGRFVGESPGMYTVVASAGGLVARSTVDVRPREAVRPIEVLGQGSVTHDNTSDLWVFEGMDGRDYAVTGTHSADGWAYFWDVTDPSNPAKTDSIQLDARTVNDVKVSPDGRYAALSREGASDRRNGVVIMDLSDPAHPTVASRYDEVTGGVHNMFATDDHLFLLDGGDKYQIVDVTDIASPRYVSEYDHPDSRIHDIWVHDGIAYSSEWQNGVVVVDVGNGRWGGTVENPVFVTNVPYPVGRTHAAFPYVQESTGKVYLFLGDEILNRRGAAYSGEGQPSGANRGYVHIIDFTDPENPEDVARYEIEEAGTHNLWVEDDVLYVAYYEGGVRAVDISGELLGNLATQGREIAVFKAFDPNGVEANAPMAWGPQPHKGNLFFSDYNSGLWAIRIQPPGRPIS